MNIILATAGYGVVALAVLFLLLALGWAGGRNALLVAITWPVSLVPALILEVGLRLQGRRGSHVSGTKR